MHSLTRAFENRTKRWNVDECSAKFYRPVQESLVLMACASSEGSDKTAHLRSVARGFAYHTKKKDVDEGLGKLL